MDSSMPRFLSFLVPGLAALVFSCLTAGVAHAETEKVALQSVQNGKYVRAGVPGGMMATSSKIEGWETFEMTRFGKDQAIFKCVQNGRYVRAGIPGDTLDALSGHAYTWEMFRIMDLGAGKIALKVAHSNKFVSTDMGKSGRLQANRDVIGPWEVFRLVPASDPAPKPLPAAPSTIALQSVKSGKFVTVDALQGGRVADTATAVGPWARFDTIPLGNNKAALRSAASGKYVRAGVGPYSYLAAISAHVGVWETFELVHVSGDLYGLRVAQSGKYVRSGMPQPGLAAQGSNLSTWELFRIHTLASNVPVPSTPGYQPVHPHPHPGVSGAPGEGFGIWVKAGDGKGFFVGGKKGQGVVGAGQGSYKGNEFGFKLKLPWK